MSDFVQHLEMEDGLAVTTWNDDAPILGFQVGVFNWRLRRAREAKGWSRADLSRHCGVDGTTVGKAEKLVKVSDQARWRMALALGVPEDVLFPGEIDALPKDGPPQIEFSMTREDVTSLAEPDPHAELVEGAERSLLRSQMEGTLDALTDRERRVLQLRFGLDGGAPKTFKETAHEFGVTRERIRQIELRALRKLRHPSRARSLRGYVEDEFTKSLPPPPKRDRCQRQKDGKTCVEQFELPGWMIVARACDLRRPMFWCGICWAGFLKMRVEAS